MNNFVVSHSNVIQVEKPSLILEFLSNSESCLEAERRLMLIIKCFQALGGDSKRFRKPESDDVVRANAKVVKKLYNRKAKKRVFQEGDKVLVLLPTDHNKLLMQWKRPFEVKVKGPYLNPFFFRLIKINTAYCDNFLRNTPRNLIWNNIDYILYNVLRRAIATRFNLAQGSHQATCTKILPYTAKINILFQFRMHTETAQQNTLLSQ